MKDDFYSKKGDGSSFGRRTEPVYDPTFTKEEIDSLFSQSNKNEKGRKAASGFKVTIPDEESIYSSSSSRTPKGKPLSSSAPSSPAVSRYESYNISSKSSPQSRTPKGRPLGSQNQAPKPLSSPSSENKFKVDIPSKPVYSSSTNGKSAALNGKKKKAKKKKSSKGLKAAIAVVCAVAIILCSIFAYGVNILGKIDYDAEFKEKNEYISSSELNKSSKVKNVLFIGSDARSEIAGMRSDTMILFSIDKSNKKIKLTSFLRDSYVCIPSTQRYRKLNAACSSGGAQLVCDTIEYNFKTEINGYVLVDFEAFTKFIDLLGGLDVPDVTANEARYLRDEVKILYAKEGDNHFSGGATLWYCRIRYLDNDFYRTERQRKVISAIIKTVAKTSPTKLFGIVEEIIPMITTNLTRNELISLGMSALASFLSYDIEQHQIPAKGTWSNARVYGEGDVLKMDIDKNAKLLKEFLYAKDSEKDTTKKDK